MNNKKRNIIILASTFILGIIAIITGIKLYQLRQESIAPTEPKAISEECTLEFTVSALTPTTTLTATPTATPTGILTPTATLIPPTSTPAPGEPTATPTQEITIQPTISPIAQGPTTTPIPPTELPSAGSTLPTVGIIAGGIILGILGLLLAL